MMERRAFLANPKNQDHAPNMENMIVVPITKRIEIIMIIHVRLISWMNTNYGENGGR